MRARRFAARAANAGLVLFGLALVVVIGTGGTRLEFAGLAVGLRRVGNPLLGFAVSAALRLLASSRRSGLEAAIVRFFARQGLAPRDAPARPLSAARAGALLGAGLGLSAAGPDALHLLLTEPPPPPSLGEAVSALALAGAGGTALGAAAGALLGPIAFAAVRAAGWRRPGRYGVGRVTLAFLWVAAAAWIRQAPPGPRAFHTPGVLLAVTGTFVLAAAVIFLLLPAAVLRARRGRWGLAVIAGGTLASLVGIAGVASLGPGVSARLAGETGHPNILLVTVTGLRSDVAGTGGEGSGWTPNLAALAARGAILDETLSPTTETLAAAASVLTGSYPASHGIGPQRPFPPYPPEALPALLAAHGYATAAFVSARELDGRGSALGGLFDAYDDASGWRDRFGRLATVQPWLRLAGPPPRSIRAAERTAAAFVSWLERLPRTPWFAWVELADPSRPAPAAPPDEVSRATVGAWFRTGGGARLDDPLPRLPAWAPDRFREEPLAHWLSGYERAVARADAALGTLLRAVELRGEAHRTIVAVTAEHGVALGERGAWFEPGPGVPEGVLRVPWIVATAGPAGGAVVPGPCSLVDVAPTLLGLAGLAGGSAWEGEDLSRYLLAGEAQRRERRPAPVYLSSAPDPSGRRLQAVRRGPWKLVRDPEGRERLFFVEGLLEGEVQPLGGRVAREHRVLSDLLTDHLARTAAIPQAR
ncbi:MAG: hypothetical protein D6718_01790 [Acidobacteria bacterium]|nr:MAG: hypothetical protein D6718_01790 [Acidobacteriota bacterium]